MPTIAKPPISQRDTENKEREIINTFLRQFFTGTPHNDDAGQPVTFPLCTIAFNQTDVRSLANPLIHWTFTSRKSCWDPGDGGMIIQTDCLNSVLVQTNTKGAMDEADQTCATVASNLMELLNSSQRRQLAELGISRCRVMRGPTALTMDGLRTRLLIVKTHLEYTVPRMAA